MVRCVDIVKTSPIKGPTTTSLKEILIADDSDSVRAAICSRLKNEPGLVVCGEAVDGLDAIEKANELQPDLILLDLRLPKLSGAAVATVLRKRQPEILIAILTMWGEDFATAASSIIGADIILSKSGGIDQLIEAMRDLLDRSVRTGTRQAQNLSGKK